MDDMNHNFEKANDAFRLPLFSIGLVLAYFISQVFTFILLAKLTNQDLLEMSTELKFYAVAANAGLWIAITTSLIPKLPLPKMKTKSLEENLKVYLSGIGLLYLCIILFNLILSTTNFKPQTQDVANQVIKMSESSLFLIILGPVLLVPLVEELLFRNLLHKSLKIKFSPLIASIISAFLFGLAHMEIDTIPQLVVIGLVLSYTYEKSGSIWVPAALHATNNFVTVMILIYLPKASGA